MAVLPGNPDYGYLSDTTSQYVWHLFKVHMEKGQDSCHLYLCCSWFPSSPLDIRRCMQWSQLVCKWLHSGKDHCRMDYWLEKKDAHKYIMNNRKDKKVTQYIMQGKAELLKTRTPHWFQLCTASSLRVWHCVPVYPTTHVQIYREPTALQAPPLRQGELLHGWPLRAEK